MEQEQRIIKNYVWLKQFKENYEGKSAEAKEVADFLKDTYNGASYIPWATMERLTYMQDPDAEFGTIPNKDGGIVWTDLFQNSNKTVAKDGTVVESEALVVSHFVKVYCKFMGKAFVEEYPIQDQDYSPLKIYNQNAVNKAIKRAMAKVASRATGIGLRLYENKDLQFEEVEEEKKPEVKKTTKKKEEKPIILEEVQSTQERVEVEEKPIETAEPVETEVVEVEFPAEVVELKDLIKNTDREKIDKVLQSLNPAVLKQHGFILSPDYDDVDLCEKLSSFKDVSVFTKAIKNMLG